MSLGFAFRDVFFPPKNILAEVGIEPGFVVLDYGCGTGSYSIAAAALVGQSGKVYSLDIHSLAVRRVQEVASKKRLTNIETILSDCATGLPEGCIDVVLLFDTLHDLSHPYGILAELYRVLKPGAICSVTDHHMKEEEIMSEVTRSGLFTLRRKGKRTYNFLKGK
jgi:ubiquinone/menaquinone biosynthesis C-methylase UbiE